MAFHIGDKVVYPNHGVGVIEQISSRTIRRHRGEVLPPQDQIQQPEGHGSVPQRGHGGLRRVVRNGEIQKIVDYMTDGECDNNADWKYRFKENSERMRTGSLLEVAAVLKSLLMLDQASRCRSAKRRCWSAPATSWSANSPWRRTCEEPRDRRNAHEGPVQNQATIPGSVGV